MKIYSLEQTFTQKTIFAASASTVLMALLCGTFFVFEPQIGRADDAEDFIVRQTILDETSFLVVPGPIVTMPGGGISGLTGGTATGTTQFVVRSNNASGYYVEIDYFDNAGAHAMRGNEDGGDQIRDYFLGAGTPTFNLTASTAAQFAYSVHSSTTADTAAAFKYSGSTCNSGSSNTAGKCWKSPSTSAVQVVNRSTAATTGATTTLYFKVHVPSAANPIPTAQVYTATATLSVFDQ
jgi:hypothetical protein